MGFRS